MRCVTGLAVSVALSALGAEPEFPPGTPLRPAKTVELVRDDGKTTVTIDFPARPGVVEDLVNLIPGETVYLEAQVKGDQLVGLKPVEKVAHPEHTLELDFKQERSMNPPAMILKVKNPFKRDLVYEAGIQPEGRQDFFKTSTVPVPAGLQSYESWPHAITRVLLRDFRLQDAKTEKKPAKP